jgi:hypothetical protein
MKTKAWGPGLEQCRVGTPTEFYIKAYNSIGMPINVGGENFRVAIDGPNGRVPATVHDNNDGTYTVRYQPDEIGNHTITVDLKTERGRGPYVPIQGSPWTVRVCELRLYASSVGLYYVLLTFFPL